LALLCVLMLRGAQTLGELRDRAARLHQFSSLEEVDATLNALCSRDPDPLVMRLPRQPGQKEARFVHLLCGEPDIELLQAEPAPRTSRADPDRLSRLEQTVESLRTEINQLQQQFGDFKKQFE